MLLGPVAICISGPAQPDCAFIFLDAIRHQFHWREDRRSGVDGAAFILGFLQVSLELLQHRVGLGRQVLDHRSLQTAKYNTFLQSTFCGARNDLKKNFQDASHLLGVSARFWQEDPSSILTKERRTYLYKVEPMALSCGQLQNRVEREHNFVQG